MLYRTARPPDRLTAYVDRSEVVAYPLLRIPT
jgi:hypothetical protein